eukprot:1759284-Prymnesium_polylepis.1
MRGPTTFPTWLGSPPTPPCAADEPPPGLVSTRVPRLTGTGAGVTHRSPGRPPGGCGDAGAETLTPTAAGGGG